MILKKKKRRATLLFLYYISVKLQGSFSRAVCLIEKAEVVSSVSSQKKEFLNVCI